MIANSRTQGPFLAQVTVEGLGVKEAREAARLEGVRLLGTEDVVVANKGWTRQGSVGFYEVTTWKSPLSR